MVFRATAVLCAIVVLVMATPLLSQSRPQGSGQPAGEPSQSAKEAELKTALFQLRNAIDTYYARHQHYPRNLRELVVEGHLSGIPSDPFTNSTTSWQGVRSRRDPRNPTARLGVFDVKSGSTRTAKDGTKYSTW